MKGSTTLSKLFSQNPLLKLVQADKSQNIRHVYMPKFGVEKPENPGKLPNKKRVRDINGGGTQGQNLPSPTGR